MNEKILSTDEQGVDVVAYDTSDKPYRGYAVRATYLKQPNNGEALIEILRRGSIWRSHRCPAYKIYNFLARFVETVDRYIANAEMEACQT